MNNEDKNDPKKENKLKTRDSVEDREWGRECEECIWDGNFW